MKENMNIFFSYNEHQFNEDPLFFLFGPLIDITNRNI